MVAVAGTGTILELYAHVSSGRTAAAARQFAADGWYAYRTGTDERAPRTVAVGLDEIERALVTDLAPEASLPEVLVCLQADADCLHEGRLVDRATREPTATIVASFQLDGSGAVTRALTFRVPPIEPSSSWSRPAAGAPADARAVLDRYFRALDSARFEDAVACFSKDVLYSHPPYWPGAERAEFRGRDELAAGFEARGPRKNYHEITVCTQRGLECLVEGYSHKPETGQTSQFISSLSLDDEGLIRRYAAFVCDTAIGRR